MISINDQITCLEMEVKRRKTIFPRLIEEGKISKEKAFMEIETMHTALQTLTQLRGIIK